MNSHLKSVGIFCPLLVLVLSGCSSPAKDQLDPAPTGAAKSEVSLSGDRQQIEDLRKNVPPEVRTENDELAEILNLTGQVKDPPQKIRERFHTLVDRHRRDFQRDMRKKRQEFDKAEKAKRKEFLAAQEKARKGFAKQKVDRDERRGFYETQESKRREYFSAELDRRKDFESDMSQKSKEFDANMRERINQFGQELKFYTDRYNEAQKVKEKPAAK